MFSDTDIRCKVLDIQKNAKLSHVEKAREIQNLFLAATGLPTEPVSNPLSPAAQEQRLKDKKPSYNNEEKKILGCKHYQRGVFIKAECCGGFYVCRFCHDEVSDHNIDRYSTKTMMCMRCFGIQPCSGKCIECGAVAAKYFCSICKLFDDDPDKTIYHCNDCGICRLGQGLGVDYFHCHKCNVCMAISLLNGHQCIERNLDCDCPICGEYMFTSTHTVMFMHCGHCIHFKCYQEYIQTSYQCPICFKSLGDMSQYFARLDDVVAASPPMPPEYAKVQACITCHDCGQPSESPMHFVHHKCSGCGGYNTRVIKLKKS